MDFKEVLKYVLAGLLGVLVVVSLANVIKTIILFVVPGILQFIIFNDLLYLITVLIELAIVIFGLYIGIWCYRKKNLWFDVFRPSKSNTSLSLIISPSLVLISFIFGTGQTTDLFIAIIIFSIIFYPFSAVAEFIYTNKKKKSYRNNKVWLLVLLILLNPFFIIISQVGAQGYYEYIQQEPCGLKVVGFEEVSPARESGIQLNEKIIRANGNEVFTVNDMQAVLDSYNPNRGLVLVTNENAYSFKLVQADGSYRMGLLLSQELCER